MTAVDGPTVVDMADQPPTREQAEQHVVYEIEAMSKAAVRYLETVEGPMKDATPHGITDAVFFLEAALGHARTLIMTFGFPSKAERRVPRALGLGKGFVDKFRPASGLGDLTANQLYGQLSGLVGHIGPIRWNTPDVVDAHRPADVAKSILDGLDAAGVSDESTAVADAIHEARRRLDGDGTSA